MSNSKSSDEFAVDHVVLVVHGVGDPQPGETISLFARSVARQDQPLVEKNEVLWLNETCRQGVCVKTYATHVRQLTYGDQRAYLAEVFWGDLSHVRRGIIGAAIGLIEILFGIRYVAYVAGLQPGWAANSLRRLGLTATSILHGPVLAVTFFLALLTLALTGTEMMWSDSYKSVFWSRVVIMACCGIALIASQMGRRLTDNNGIKGFWFWVSVVTTFVAGLLMLKMLWIDQQFPQLAFSNEVRPGMIWYCRILVMLLGLLWLVEMMVVLAMGACWIAACMRPNANRPGLHVAFLLPAIAVGFWGFVLPMAWLSAAKSLRRFAKLEHFDDLFHEAVPLLGVQIMMVLFVAIAAAMVLARYAHWRAKVALRANGDGTAIEPPRLIVHGGLQMMIAVCTLLGVTGVAAISLMQLLDSYRHFLDPSFAHEAHNHFWGESFLTEANKYAVALMVPAGFLSFLIFPHLRPVLDIILDVMNHFYFRPTRITDLIDGNEFGIQETTIEKGNFFFSKRDSIHLRIKRTLAHFRDHVSNRPTLTIISHSQGTMIGIEVLNDPELSWLNTTFSSVRLVTMGSPMRHLYQHYFLHLYPPLSHSYWKALRTRLNRWINIYRVDDFVGTRIDFPDNPLSTTANTSPSPPTCNFSNHMVGAHGHLHYWTDRKVLDIMQRELLQHAGQQPSLHRKAA